jgi:hypothetical protein
MDKYTITIKKKSTAVAVAGYADGVCCLVQIETPGLTPEQAGWILRTVPAAEADLPALELAFQFVKVDRVPTDLSFNAFWDAYAYKVGKRERAMKLWASMSDADKTKCLRSIPRYNQWLMTKFNMERLYPETYLHQARYNNDFKI